MTVTNLEAHAYTLEALRNKKGFICDMDGVIYHGNLLLPGVREFYEHYLALPCGWWIEE